MCTNKYYIEDRTLSPKPFSTANCCHVLGYIQVFNTRRHPCTLCVSTKSNIGLANPQIYTIGHIRSAISPTIQEPTVKDSNIQNNIQYEYIQYETFTYD